MLLKIKTFAKRETVLCIAAVCAILSMLITPPSAQYASYIDFRVLGLLWCLMAVVAGWRSCGLFDALTGAVLSRGYGGKTMALLFAALPFFAAMAVTNDVALIAFVPFTLDLLRRAGYAKKSPGVLVVQTVAANLGSMATPVGNPQNLYIYSHYGVSAGEFFRLMLPVTLLGLLLVAASSLFTLPTVFSVQAPKMREKPPLAKTALYCVLFTLSLLAVFRVIPWQISTAAVLLSLAAADRKILREPDYALLVTFVCFFVFSGNIGSFAPLKNALSSALAGNTLLTSAAASQVISNVPAAVLLSGFTYNWRGLLLGVDIGGLGTPVASLASLITLKFYMSSENAETGRFIAVFLAVNAAFLAFLLAFGLLIESTSLF